MGSKIVTIGVTIFMLVVCLLSVATLTIINKEKSRDIADDLLADSALSTNYDIEESSRLVVSGSSLISSIVGIYEIDNKILDGRDKLYLVSNSTDVPIAAYIFDYNGTRSNPDIVRSLNPDAKYELEYTASAGASYTIIKIKLA